MTLPNFLIIGAAKAGTTTLYDHLRAHPQVFMPDLKEPKFFGYEGRGDDRRFPVKTLAQYRALFDGVTTETAIGEASPHYLYAPRAAERIKATLADVRIVASLRDPVERVFSVYQMNARNRRMNAHRSFLEAVAVEPALRRGYHDDLKRYLDLFGRERVKIILFDDLARDTSGVVREVLRFLAVDPARAATLPRVSNPGGMPRLKLLHAILTDHRLHAYGRRFAPAPLLKGVKRLRSLNLEKRTLTEAERTHLQALFRDDILRTQDLIGRSLAAWLRR